MTSTAETSELPLARGRSEEEGSLREVPTLVIEPRTGWGVDLRELWNYRELFGFLVWRDIKIRYAQTVLGAGWAILQPVLTMVVFTIIFGNFANIPSDGVPYPVFSLAALVPWTYFAAAITNSSSSLVNSTNLITKIYFPRLVIPLSPVLSGLVDLTIAFGILVLMMMFYGIVPGGATAAVLPLTVLILLMTAAGVGSWLSAMNLRYRDIRYVVPFLVQVWMYASPIVYPTSLIPERFQQIYALNPMVGVVEGFRSSLLGTTEVPWHLLGVSLLAAAVIFVSGVVYFRRTERYFADVV